MTKLLSVQSGDGMSHATLAVEHLEGGVKRVTVDCGHGTTTSHALNSVEVGEPAIVAAVVQAHHAAEGCRCTRELRRQYPPSLLPRALWVGAGLP